MIKSPKTILRLLRSKKTSVKVHALGKEDGLKGWVDYRYGVIHIEHTQTIPLRVSTLIHECLHLLNPQYQKKEHEYIIEGVEFEVVAKLSKKEYNLLKKYVA